jgi:hypothetical protein
VAARRPVIGAGRRREDLPSLEPLREPIERALLDVVGEDDRMALAVGRRQIDEERWRTPIAAVPAADGLIGAGSGGKVAGMMTPRLPALAAWPGAFLNDAPFGRSFQCATLDVRRRGTLESYF